MKEVVETVDKWKIVTDWASFNMALHGQLAHNVDANANGYLSTFSLPLTYVFSYSLSCYDKELSSVDCLLKIMIM